MEAHRDTLNLVVDTEGGKRAVRTVPEGHRIVEGQVVGMVAARIAHSLGQKPVEEEEELVVRRRLVEDSHFGR